MSITNDVETWNILLRRWAGFMKTHNERDALSLARHVAEFIHENNVPEDWIRGNNHTWLVNEVQKILSQN